MVQRDSSLLRDLAEGRRKFVQAASLLDAALQIRRAGLEHLVQVTTQDELDAMALAGERLEDERAARFAQAVLEPEEALAPFDGGKSLARKVKARDELVMARALEKARR